MKRSFLRIAGMTALLMCLVMAKAEVDIKNCFPDSAFRSYVSAKCDQDNDGFLSDSEIRAVDTIDVKGNHIASLKGIECFSDLQYLYCDWNDLTALDLNSNHALKTVNCSHNQLTSLKFRDHPALAGIACFSNQISAIDLSGAPSLHFFSGFSNLLTEIDLSHNPLLDDVDIWDNRLKSLDVSHNPALRILFCSGNCFSELDISHNRLLSQLTCDDTEIKTLDISNNDFLVEAYHGWKDDRNGTAHYHTQERIHESGDCELEVDLDVIITCSDIPAFKDGKRTLSRTNFKDPRFLSFLRRLGIDDNEDGLLSEEEIAAVWELNCRDEGIRSLDGIRFFTALEVLLCDYNRIKELDVSGNGNLKTLDCGTNELTELKVKNCVALDYLWCDRNQLMALDISGCPVLIDHFISSDYNFRYDERLDSDHCFTNVYFNYVDSPGNVGNLILPFSMGIVESEAYRGAAATSVYIPEGVTAIQPMAFADCPNLLHVYIPSFDIAIDRDAFKNVRGLTLHGPRGSSVETFARENGYSFQ